MENTKKLSFKDAARLVLKSAGKPLSAKEITKRALESGIIETTGKTPDATIGAILYVDMKNENSEFIKAGKGLFALKTPDTPHSPETIAELIENHDEAFQKDVLQKLHQMNPAPFESLIKPPDAPDPPATTAEIIENHNAAFKEELMQTLYQMDPFQFEHLIADLLGKMGYDDVETTKKSGDNGIDVLASRTMDGITRVKTVVQAKRYNEGNPIGSSVITQLRGSAEVDQRGLLITTSNFTKAAIKEAKAPNKIPVSLVDGERLLSLLIEHRLGIKSGTVTLHSVDTSYFDKENSEDASK